MSRAALSQKLRSYCWAERHRPSVTMEAPLEEIYTFSLLQPREEWEFNSYGEVGLRDYHRHEYSAGAVGRVEPGRGKDADQCV